jgi:hypothetical protein
MASSGEELTSSLALETRRLRAEFTELNRVSASFGRTVTSAFAGAISGGRKLSDVLRSLVASLSRQTLSAALRPLGNAIGGQLANLAFARQDRAVRGRRHRQQPDAVRDARRHGADGRARGRSHSAARPRTGRPARRPVRTAAAR